MIASAAVTALHTQLRAVIGGQRHLSAAERDVQLAYVSGNAWRYAVTLDCIRRTCGRPLAGLSVLDVGAYPGHLATVLSRTDGAKVTAVSLVTSPAFEAQMREAGVDLVVSDVERDRLPAEDASIAIVLCSELIEHLDGEVRHLLTEARRVLAETGVFVLTTPNHAAFSRRWALLRGRSVYPQLDDPVYPFYAGAGRRNPWRHAREFTADEICVLLRQAGFGGVESTTVSPPFAGRDGLSARGYLSSTIIQAAARLIPAGGTLIVATARGSY